MNLLLVSATDWILPGILVLMIIGLFVMSAVRNKKYQQSAQEMASKLKKGDRVKTYSGFYGKIIEIRETSDGKIAVLETGNDKNKGYLIVDINAIYGVIDEKPITKETEQPIVEEKVESVIKKESAKENTEQKQEVESTTAVSEPVKENKTAKKTTKKSK